jgi:aerobic carbon-monoxide dehydrogenase medium subunit
VTTLPPFSVHRAGTVEEASALLERFDDEAVLYSGGTELLLVYKFGFADYPNLIDIKGIEELHGITVERDALRVGAAVRHVEIERSQLVAEHVPALAAMERNVGNVRVRTQGTIGGNLCFADPHSDPATFLIAAGGWVTARSGGAEPRTIAVEDFVLGPFETALAPGELLTAVHVPRPRPGSALVHRKISFHERPAVTVAANVRLEGEVVAEARLAVGSVGVTPVRVGAAEAALGDGAVDEAAEAAAAAVEPVADANGSVEYKRHLVRVLVGRCLRQAISEARAA